MSTYPFPTETDVEFNAVDWLVNPNVGITQADADMRYIFKTQSDTATGQITFTNGILTNSLQTYTGNLNIGSTGSANNMIIGSSNSNVKIGGIITLETKDGSEGSGLILTGNSLISNTSSGDANLFLSLTIGSTIYKIKLENA